MNEHRGDSLAAGSSPEAKARGTIVVAEDDEATRMLLCAILRRAGFVVHAVEDGRSACETVVRERPDALLLDWVMPVMDGRAATQWLKATPETRGIPIVMLTTHSEIEERVTALEAGVQDFITKPFDARELVARLDQQIRWRKVLARDANEMFAAQRLAIYRSWQTRRERMDDSPEFFNRIWGDAANPKHQAS